MRRTLFFAALASSACSGGSGVDSGKALAALDDTEYQAVCKYFNDKAQLQVGQICMQTQMKVLRVLYLDCGHDQHNPFAGSTCTAKVSDVESCASRDACGLLDPQSTTQCKRVAECGGGI